MRQLSMFSKMILFGCALCVLPVLALGTFSYLKSSDSVQSQMDQANIDILKQMNGNIEQVLKTTDNNLNQVVNSTIMQDAMYGPITVQEFQLYHSFRKNLGNLQSLDTPVSDVVVLNYRNNWLINNERLYEFEKFPQKNELMRLDEFPFDSTWSLKRTSQLGSPSTDVLGCSYTIALAKKLPIRSSEKRGLALAYIPSCSLSSLIDIHSNSQEMMIIDSDNNIVVQRDHSLIGKSVIDTGYIDDKILRRMGDNEGQLEIEASSNQYTLTYIRSEYNGWLYILLTDIHSVTRQSREIGWVTLYASLLIIVVSVCFVWLGSRRMYTPIRGILKDISKRLPEQQQKASNEFQLINDHIEQLFVSNSSMKKEISQNSQQLRTFFLTKLFQGQLKQSEITDKMKLYGYEEHLKKWEHLVVLTMQVEMADQTRYSLDDLDLLLFAANNIVEESIPAPNRLIPVIIDQTQVTLIGCSGMMAGELHNYVYTLTESIRTHIRTYLHLNVTIGISLPFWSVQKAARAYREGMEALKHRLKFGEGITIDYANINSGKHTFIYPYPRQIENEMVDSIKLVDEDRALQLLGQWMAEVFSKDRSPNDYQISLVRLLNNLTIIMQESGIHLERIQTEGSSIYDELLQLYIPSEIEHWFIHKVIMPMIQTFRERGESHYRNLSEAVIDMIQHHYDTDFTLEECASKLHYNSNYLSGIFKKETKMSFSDYLGMYRMDMAKRWLTESELAIKDIAERLTYNNPQNFIRSFRKHEAMTPGQYREKNRGHEP